MPKDDLQMHSLHDILGISWTWRMMRHSSKRAPKCPSHFLCFSFVSPRCKHGSVSCRTARRCRRQGIA